MMSRVADRSSAIIVFLMLIGWALPGIFVRFLPELKLLELSAWRLIPATLPFFVLLIVSARFRQSFLGVLGRVGLWLPAALMASYYVISNIGLRAIPVAVVALLISLAPVWVMIYERLLGKHYTPREYLGVLLAFTGLVVCLSPGLLGVDMRLTYWGVFASVLSGIVSAGFVLMVRGRSNGDSYQPLAISFLVILMGFPILGLSYGVEAPFGLLNLEPIGIVNLLALGVVSTALPTLCYAIISTRLSAVTTALMNLMVPPSAAVAAWLILDEHLPVAALLGGAICLCGVLIVVTRKA